MDQPKKPTAALFIDSSNFYHTLKNMRLLPFDQDEFRQLFEAISERFDLEKIFFYDAIKSSEKDPEGYSGQQRFHERLKKTTPILTIKTRKLRYLANVTDEQIQEVGARVGIDPGSITKLKDFLLGLNLIRLTKEKGIDIQLVVDAIEEARSGNYNSILLLSGDADFVPAVTLIRSFGTRTVNLHLYQGSSNELRISCDEHILIIPRPEGIILKSYSTNRK